MTHIVKGYVIYELPFGHGKRFGGGVNSLANAFISGWSLNGDFHYNTGTPIQILSTTSYPGFNAVYMDITPGCTLTNGGYAINKQWFNPKCFTNPTGGQLGTAGHYLSQIRNPGLATEDLGVHKGFSMRPENQYKLTFRMEFFNVFNRHQLAGPDTNFAHQGNSDPTQNTFGQIISYNSSLGGRVGQFGARFTF
jgi:hypothetical protein